MESIRISRSAMGRRIVAMIIALMGVMSLSLGTVARSAADEGGTVDMYRLYNKKTGEHFYTKDSSERDQLKSRGWRYEGVGWVAPSRSDTPVYRLYNPSVADHHYDVPHVF